MLELRDDIPGYEQAYVSLEADYECRSEDLDALLDEHPELKEESLEYLLTAGNPTSIENVTSIDERLRQMRIDVGHETALHVIRVIPPEAGVNHQPTYHVRIGKHTPDVAA